MSKHMPDEPLLGTPNRKNGMVGGYMAAPFRGAAKVAETAGMLTASTKVPIAGTAAAVAGLTIGGILLFGPTAVYNGALSIGVPETLLAFTTQTILGMLQALPGMLGMAGNQAALAAAGAMASPLGVTIITAATIVAGTVLASKAVKMLVDSFHSARVEMGRP